MLILCSIYCYYANSFHIAKSLFTISSLILIFFQSYCKFEGLAAKNSVYLCRISFALFVEVLFDLDRCKLLVSGTGGRSEIFRV